MTIRGFADQIVGHRWLLPLALTLPPAAPLTLSVVRKFPRFLNQLRTSHLARRCPTDPPTDPPPLPCGPRLHFDCPPTHQPASHSSSDPTGWVTMAAAAGARGAPGRCGAVRCGAVRCCELRHGVRSGMASSHTAGPMSGGQESAPFRIGGQLFAIRSSTSDMYVFWIVCS
jgi:hypothetical protein